MNNHPTPQAGLNFLFCNRRLPFLGVLALVCLLALSSQPAGAQTVFGSMVGNVTDASGAAVPGADVKITLTTTNDTRTCPDRRGRRLHDLHGDAGHLPGRDHARQGFRTFVVTDILVNQNNVVRVDAQLQVGALTEKVEVTTTAAAELQTERADVHAEIATEALIDLPQPNRTYEGLLELVPGTAAPGGQLGGGTNNPSKSMTFAFNGTGTPARTVRIEGINAMNLWNPAAQTYVPSVEAIQNVNVATNANDAEQGMAGGASVNVMLKSGSNETHGGAYEYNSDSGVGGEQLLLERVGHHKPPHLVDNDTGGFAGGHILRNKLFYFGSYEGDFAHSAYSRMLSIPNAVATRRQYERLEQPHLRSQHGESRRHRPDAISGQHYSVRTGSTRLR